jgi:membrane-associated HD superfamily phosphohydrolase
VRQLAVLVGFFAAVLLIVELPHPPLPVYLGQKTAHPILARVDFDYVDHEVTANVKSLVALLRVPGLYTPDARQVASLRENLLAMVGEAAKAASLEQVPEAARTEWKLAPETFAALKQALGDKPENLAAVREAVTKALAPLADPIALPIVREEDYQRAVQRLNNIKDLRNKLPAGLSPEAAPMPEEPAAVIIVLSPQGDQTLPLKGVLMQTQTEPIQARIERLIEDPLVPIFGNKGISALAAAMAPRVGPTLVYDQAQTENRRVEAKKDVQDVRILHKANTTLVDAGEEINEGTLQVLKQEQAARIAQLGWVRTTLAWIGAAVVLALLVFLLADYTMRFQPNIGRSFPRSLMLALLCLLVIGVAKWVA